ncbi:Aldehyde/histidinol dehydrogenase [Infundibulicybe gibba]|nr:Aldehyde/histidinol dehydrogenase [Infundibulicybe gibba]
MPPCTPLFINGRNVESPNTFEVKNPFSGQVVGTAVSASSEECQAAIKAAGDAFNGWAKMNLNTKRDIFRKAAAVAATEKYKSMIMTVLQEETESVPYWCFLNWLSAGGCLHSAAELVGDLRGDSFPSATVPGSTAVTQRRPYGVVKMLTRAPQTRHRPVERANLALAPGHCNTPHVRKHDRAQDIRI